MTRTQQLDPQHATVNAVRQAQAKPRPGKYVDTGSPVLAMPAVEDTVGAAERRAAAGKVADLALRHPCDLDPTRGITTCTHPGHEPDADRLRAVLEVLALRGHDPYGHGDDGPEHPGSSPDPPSATEPTGPARPSFIWQDAASCRGMDLVLFFGADGERQSEREIRERKAKQICMGCPARTGCLDYAVSAPEKYGTWGGLNEVERASERRRRMRRAA